MLVADVNVLVAAYRADHPHHGAVRPWWDAIFEDRVPLVIPDIVWVGFVRIVTHRRVFAVPSSIGEALDFLVTVRAHPATRDQPSSGVVGNFVRLGREGAVTGNLVTDAWIAAVAETLSCPVATFDRDFGRFPGLRTLKPG